MNLHHAVHRSGVAVNGQSLAGQDEETPADPALGDLEYFPCLRIFLVFGKKKGGGGGGYNKIDIQQGKPPGERMEFIEDNVERN